MFRRSHFIFSLAARTPWPSHRIETRFKSESVFTNRSCAEQKVVRVFPSQLLILYHISDISQQLNQKRLKGSFPLNVDSNWSEIFGSLTFGTRDSPCSLCQFVGQLFESNSTLQGPSPSTVNTITHSEIIARFIFIYLYVFFELL